MNIILYVFNLLNCTLFILYILYYFILLATNSMVYYYNKYNNKNKRINKYNILSIYFVKFSANCSMHE